MVTGADTTVAVEVVAGDAGVSDAAGVGAGSSCLGGWAAVAVAASGAGDFPDPVTRVVTGFTVDRLGGSLTARAVATLDAGGAAALRTGAGAIGAGAIGGVLGATATAAGAICSRVSEPVAAGAADRRGNATAATTSTTAARGTTARSHVSRGTGTGGFAVGGVPGDRAGATEDPTGTRAFFFTSDFARRGFLAGFFARAPLFAPASGNTSIVHRTRRPARSGRVRFATATGRRNARAGRFPEEFGDRWPRCYKIGGRTFNSVAVRKAATAPRPSESR